MARSILNDQRRIEFIRIIIDWLSFGKQWFIYGVALWRLHLIFYGQHSIQYGQKDQKIDFEKYYVFIR